MAFDEIFDLDKTRDRSLLREPDATAMAGELDAVVGRKRQARTAQGAGHDVPRLVAMVDAAAADRAPMAASPMPAAARRAPRRIDWVTVIAGGAAVVAVAVASTLTAVQIATASPVGDALVLLESDEEVLSSSEQALGFSRARLDEEIALGVERAAALRANVVALTARAEEEPFVDPAALAAVQAAAVKYEGALAAVVLPADLPAWTPAATDESSLPSVAAALDAVQERAELVEAATAELTGVSRDVEDADAEFSAALASFSTSLESALPGELDASPDPSQDLRDAVQATNERVVGTDLAADGGAAALRAYRDSVRALRAEQLRMAIAREQQSQQNGSWDQGSQTEAPAPTEPTTPTNPGTTDPETTEPGTDPAG